MDMKKLYALLIILIVIYVGINVSANGLNILSVGDSQTTGGNGGAAAGNVNFPQIDGYSLNKINDTDVKYVDNKTGVNIEVKQIDNTKNASDIYKSLSNGGTFTSSQEVDQNGVPTYYLYKEGQTGYDTEIYFNKNNQNFKITGHNVTYENSDSFINSCKQIVDSI